MDLVYIILGGLLMLGGIIGSFLPILPGPLTSWVGLLLLYFSPNITVSKWLLGITLVIALVVYIIDYFIPAMGTKKFGGSKYGMYGTTIGLIIGLVFFPPFGLIIGPFLGAFLGEVIGNKSSTTIALKAAFGSFMGFAASTFLKFLIASIYLGLYLWIVISNSPQLFS